MIQYCTYCKQDLDSTLFYKGRRTQCRNYILLERKDTYYNIIRPKKVYERRSYISRQNELKINGVSHCNFCNHDLPISNFYTKKLTRCKKCYADYNRTHQKAPADKQPKRTDEWRKVHEDINSSKVCNTCNELKSITQFHKDSFAKDGRRACCGRCIYMRSNSRSFKNVLSNDNMTSKARFKIFIGVTDAEIYNVDVNRKEIIFKIFDTSQEYLKIKDTMNKLYVLSNSETGIDSKFIEYFDGGLLLTTTFYGNNPILIDRHYQEQEYENAIKSFFIDENSINVAGHMIISSTAKRVYKFIVTHIQER